MPCVNTQNGQPVPGQMGSCPAGSHWIMSEQDQQLMQQNEGYTDIVGQQQYGLGGTPADLIGGSIKAGAGLGVAAATALKNPTKIKSLMGSLIDKGKGLGTKLKNKSNVKATQASYTDDISLRLKEAGIPGTAALKALLNNPQGRKRLRSLGITAPMIATLMMRSSDAKLFGNGTGDSTATSTPPAATPNAAEIAAKAEAARVAGLNPLESMLENMKKKGFWTDPINKDGSRTDTRLNRLGILMDYYGKDPVQRAASTSPSEQFAQSDKNYADLQEAYAKAQATLNAGLAGNAKNWSKAEIEQSLGVWFDKKFGIDMPFFGKNRAESKALFLRDAVDEKARHPELNLDELANKMLIDFPNRYR